MKKWTIVQRDRVDTVTAQFYEITPAGALLLFDREFYSGSDRPEDGAYGPEEIAMMYAPGEWVRVFSEPLS